MQFTVLQKNLLKGLNIVGKAVNARSPLPILGNILFSTDKGRLKLTASDLEMTISTWIGAKIDREGEVTIPAKLINEFVSQISEEKISVDVDGNNMNMTTEKLNAVFNGTTADEFPVNKKMDSEISFKLNSKDFFEALTKVQFSVAVDESRPVLTGVLFVIDGDSLKLVGLDGFRLSEHSIKMDKSVNVDSQFIVPARALFDISKNFTDYSEVSIGVNLESQNLLLSVDDIEVQIKLIAGEYPDYQAIIPDEYNTTITVDRLELTNSIKLVSVFARELGYSVKFSVKKDGIIEAESKPTEIGSNKVKIESKVEGDDITIVFNAKFLLDFLNHINSDKVQIKTVGTTKPGLLVPVSDNSGSKDKGGSSQSDYWYLVMPMSMNW